MRRMYSNEELKRLLDEFVYQPSDGKKYKIVAGVIRNDDGQWKLVGESHDEFNIKQVDNNTSIIQVKYKFKAKNVVSFVVTPDERFASLGYFCGSSVGEEVANIEIYREVNAGGYIAYNGEGFTCSGDITEATIGAGGTITISHIDTGASLGRAVAVRGGHYIASFDGVNEAQDTISLYDYDGVKVTTPDTDFKLFWSNSARPEKVAPADADQVGNLWVLGVFEVE